MRGRDVAKGVPVLAQPARLPYRRFLPDAPASGASPACPTSRPATPVGQPPSGLWGRGVGTP